MGKHKHHIIAFVSVLIVQCLGVRSVNGLIAPNRLFGSRGSLLIVLNGGDAPSPRPCNSVFWPNAIHRRECRATKRAASLTNNGEPQPPNGNGTKRDPETPKQWTAETTPFQVVRYYAREGVTDEQITACLAEHDITSLEKLNADIWVAGSIIRSGTSQELVLNVVAALKRNKKTAAEVLGGTLIHDESCISESQLDLYSEKAVSVSYHGEEFKVRCPSISLVMGPSGSGKTMFALKNLPRIALPKAKSDKEIFRLHVKAKTLLRSETKAKVDLCARLVAYVKETVANKLWATFGTNEPPPIDLFLFVTIDEAGRTEFKDYFDEADKMENLAYALGNMTDYKFEKGVHVAVAGTALDTTTSGIDSVSEAKKYHMQPWSSSNFHALLEMLHRKDQEEVKQIVGRFHILSSLITNARCAFFLADTMPTITTTNEARWAGYVDLTVPQVAYCYIETNGLKELVSPDRRFTVAQEAFKAIDAATQLPNVARYPSFDHIENSSVRSCIQSLLDINVDIADGKAVLTRNSMFSVSMTPAILVVLAELLCTKAQVCWDWRDFENAAALGEWKKMITDMQPSDFTDESGIIRLRSPLPGTKAKTRFTLPIIGRSTVLVNGRGAPYADVIAPFRLVQAKFSEDTEKVLQLNFETEMGKMGLFNTDNYQLQQATTSALYYMWQQKFKKLKMTKIKIDRFEKLKYREDARSEHYPCQTLLSGDIGAEESVIFSVDFAKGIVRPTAGKGSTKLENPIKIKILEEFSNQPVTAVFVTNVARIFIKSEVEKADLLESKIDGGASEGDESESSKEVPNDEDGDEIESSEEVPNDEEGDESENSEEVPNDSDFAPASESVSIDTIPNDEENDSIFARASKDVSLVVKGTGNATHQNVTYIIGRDDVDWRGVLQKPLPYYLIKNFRKNVDVRFILY